MSYSRGNRDKALFDFLHSVGSGSIAHLRDVLENELHIAMSTLETSSDTVILFRAQGRVLAIRELIKCLTPKQTDIGG